MKIILLILLSTCLSLGSSEYPRFKHRGPQQNGPPRPPGPPGFSKKWGKPPQKIPMHFMQGRPYSGPPQQVRNGRPKPPAHHNHGMSIPVGNVAHHMQHSLNVPKYQQYSYPNKPQSGPMKNNYYKHPVQEHKIGPNMQAALAGGIVHFPQESKKIPIIHKQEKSSFVSSPSIPQSLEYDYHIQTNNIPINVNPIKQVGEKGPIHTIPAPNLTPADKPNNIELKKQNYYQQQQENRFHQPQYVNDQQHAHQYQVTEPSEQVPKQIFSEHYDQNPASQNYQNANQQSNQYLNQQLDHQNSAVQSYQNANQQSNQYLNQQLDHQNSAVQSYQNANQQSNQYLNQQLDQQNSAVQSYQNANQQSNQYLNQQLDQQNSAVQSYQNANQQSNQYLNQHLDQQNSAAQSYQNLQSYYQQDNPGLTVQDNGHHGININFGQVQGDDGQEDMVFSNSKHYQVHEVSNDQYSNGDQNQNTHTHAIQSSYAQQQPQVLTFLEEPGYLQQYQQDNLQLAEDKTLNVKPVYHSFNYNEQDHQAQQAQSGQVDYYSLGSPGEIIKGEHIQSRTSSDPLTQAQIVQSYFETRQENAEEPDAKPSDSNNSRKDTLKTPYYTSLPSKEAAERLAKLQAAGKVNNSLMQMTSINRNHNENVNDLANMYATHDNNSSDEELDRIDQEQEYEDYSQEEEEAESDEETGLRHKIKSGK